jgi:tetratricopeptide (TPR) repeat protein
LTNRFRLLYRPAHRLSERFFSGFVTGVIMAAATRPVGIRENEPGKARDGQRTRRSSEPAEAAQHELSMTALLLGAFMVVAVGAVVLAGVDRVGPALLWCFGCLLTGFVVGFLFGFPRVITYDQPAPTPPAGAAVTDANNPASAVAYRLGVNTNLEQVSDWLTKIIVGVGLVELKNVPGYLRAAGEYIGAGFGEAAGALVFQQRLAAGIVVAFGGLGVLSGYLLTRMFFSAAFRRADAGTIGIAEEQGRTIAAIPLERGGGQKVHLPEAMGAAWEKLLSASLQSVGGSPSELAAWARVQFEAGRYDQAIIGYENAVAKDPRDARLRHSYAIAMKYGGRPRPDCMFQLEKSLELARSSSDLGLQRDIYASYTFNALYLDRPEGFLRARKAAEEYVLNRQSLPSGDVWLNLACAYGQQYDEASKAPGVDAETLRALRDKALDALKSSVRVDPRLNSRAQQLLDGRAEGDDDLKAFEKDKEFREAVGLPAP